MSDDKLVAIGVFASNVCGLGLLGLFAFGDTGALVGMIAGAVITFLAHWRGKLI